MNLESFFNPKSIAVVGASAEVGTIGNVLAKNLLTLGYAGKVFFVNPKHETILDKPCYKNLNEINEEIDLAIVAIPAKFVNEVVGAAKDKIKNFVIISAGFAEINEEGNKREEELKKIARDSDLNILGPNCLGFIIPSLKLNASFAGGIPKSGNISLVSQSGALAVAIMDAAKSNGLKFSNVISIGNKMQIEEAKILEYLNTDKKTKVIGIYLEGIKDGKDFVSAVQKISKPVVILKAGKTKKSQEAITSHTGAMVGNDEVLDEVFKELGIIRAQNVDEFMSELKLISKIKKPKNNKVIIITNAGGLGVLATDAFKDKKIEIAEINEEIKTELRKILPEESALGNPIDLLGDADEKRYAAVLEIVEKAEADAIICLLTPQDQTPVEKIAEVIINFRKNSGKVIAAVFMGGDKVKKAVKKLDGKKIPAFFILDEAINALDKFCQCCKIKYFEPENSQTGLNNEIFGKAQDEGRKILNYQEASGLLKQYNITMPVVYKIEDVNIEYPVAVKIDSEKFLHKTDQGAMRLNVKNKEELDKVILEMQNKFHGESMIIQPMAPKGTELIIGMKRDADFGPVISFGLGGIYTEIFKINDLMLANVNKERIKEKILESKIKFLFSNSRGQAPYNLDEMVKIVTNLSKLSLENTQITELDINPLIVYNNGKNAQAVDVKVIIKN